MLQLVLSVPLEPLLFHTTTKSPSTLIATWFPDWWEVV
jgi:hypothetical protein